MGNKPSSIRYASPNERRVITREDLGYYRSLYVGGIYQSNTATLDLTSQSTFLPGLRRCLKDHPPLSVIVERPETEKPFYSACPVPDFSTHIDVLPTVDDIADLDAIEAASPGILDTKPLRNGPPWKIVILPLKSANDERASRCFIAFAYSHALGDGISGLAFHKSFLASLQNPAADMYQKPVTGAMPTCFDTKKNLPISWSYPIGPALGAYSPKFVAKAFGFRAAATTVSSTTWLGSDKVFLDADHHSGSKIMLIDGKTLSQLVAACRKHDTKLTSLLHQAIIYTLSTTMQADNGIDNFVSGTAINMRHHVDVSNDVMGMYVTGYYDVHPRIADTGNVWNSANRMHSKLHECSNRLHDQSIGLLRYVPSIRSWTAGHIGGKRDASYEISNLLAFDPSTGDPRADDASWVLGNMIFAQPANVTGAPLCFNVVARKGGDLICMVTWQVGALGVGDENEEHEFVNAIRDKLIGSIKDLV